MALSYKFVQLFWFEVLYRIEKKSYLKKSVATCRNVVATFSLHVFILPSFVATMRNVFARRKRCYIRCYTTLLQVRVSQGSSQGPERGHMEASVARSHGELP